MYALPALADSPDTASSWPGLVAQLNKTFLLIRDVFGYALPGAVFLTIGLISHRFSLIDVRNLLNPYQPPGWAMFLMAVVACYAMGEILASVTYMPIALHKIVQWGFVRSHLYPPPKGEITDANVKKRVYLLQDNPTEVTADLLAIRTRHPELFVESDRRETLMLLGGSMATALLSGWLVFYVFAVKTSVVFAVAGFILVIQFCTAPSHLRRVRMAIREADSKMAATPALDPDFKRLLEDMIKAATKLMNK